MISSDSDEVHLLDANLTAHQVEQTSSLSSIFALGKLNRQLKSYDDDKITNFDKRLFKGFYVANEEELLNDSEQEACRYMNRCDFGRARNLLKMVNVPQAQKLGE